MPTENDGEELADANHNAIGSSVDTPRGDDGVRRLDPGRDQTLTTAVTAAIGLTATRTLMCRAPERPVRRW